MSSFPFELVPNIYFLAPFLNILHGQFFLASQKWLHLFPATLINAFWTLRAL